MNQQNHGRPVREWDWMDSSLLVAIALLAVVTGALVIPDAWLARALDAQRPFARPCIWTAVGLSGVLLLVRCRPAAAGRGGLDWVIGLAAVGFVVAFGMPWARWWLDRPRPGTQVADWHVASVGRGHAATPCEMGYLLYLPPEYDRDARPWPLVVFLHGSGERGDDPKRVCIGGLPKFADEGKAYDFILLSPQCSEEQAWSPQEVVDLIEHISKTCRVDRDRVYVTGYSMGGSGTWATAAFEPSRIAAIVPLCGGGRIEDAGRFVDIPVWAFHGAEDEAVSLAASKEMVDAVRAAGGSAKLTVYPGQGHGIVDLPYQDPNLFQWLLAQRRQAGKGRSGNEGCATANGQEHGKSMRSIAGDGSRSR